MNKKQLENLYKNIEAQNILTDSHRYHDADTLKIERTIAIEARNILEDFYNSHPFSINEKYTIKFDFDIPGCPNNVLDEFKVLMQGFIVYFLSKRKFKARADKVLNNVIHVSWSHLRKADILK